jgi:hypothetical protein
VSFGPLKNFLPQISIQYTLLQNFPLKDQQTCVSLHEVTTHRSANFNILICFDDIFIRSIYFSIIAVPRCMTACYEQTSAALMRWGNERNIFSGWSQGLDCLLCNVSDGVIQEVVASLGNFNKTSDLPFLPSVNGASAACNTNFTVSRNPHIRAIHKTNTPIRWHPKCYGGL